MRPCPTRWGLAIAAGLVWMSWATPARAQFAYGYDSFLYGSPPPQTFWANAGFQSVYTDPSTGVFAGNEVTPPRTVAPYANPPYDAFQKGNGLPTVALPRVAAPANKPAVRQRRGLIRGRVKK